MDCLVSLGVMYADYHGLIIFTVCLLSTMQYSCVYIVLFLNRKCAHTVQTWCCRQWQIGTCREIHQTRADFQEYWMLHRIQRLKQHLCD